MKKLFGTDGMRGEAGHFPLDAQSMRRAGSSLAVQLREGVGRKPVIVSGRDTRESGSWLEQALIEGATRAGAECKSAGIITTPGVAFLARDLPADAGVVISASHNPYQDNGIKIFAPSGRKVSDKIERLIEADIFAETETRQAQHQHQHAIKADEVELRARYLDFLAAEVGQGLLLNNLRIVIDCANGAASDLAPALFERLGARVIAINNNPDGRNINRDCGSLHIQGLQGKVVTEGADLGVAFDGDADRSLFVDAKGQFVDGDATLWALAKYLHGRNELSHGLVVATVMDELLSSGASLGGEQSGHIIFPRLSLAGDGMITTLRLVRAMKEEGKTLDELTGGFERYPQLLINIRVSEKRPFSEIDSIQRLILETESKLGERGRLLLRYSGTEPLARVMIEGQDQREIEKYANDLAEEIGNTLGLKPC